MLLLLLALSLVCGTWAQPCVQQGYNLTSLMGADLLYSGAAADGNVYAWAIRPCGAVASAGFCTAQPGEFCQGAVTVSSMNLTDASGITVGNGAQWAAVTTGGQSGVAQLLQDGTACQNVLVDGVYVTFDRAGTIQYLCNASATTAFISSIVESPACHFTAIVQTSAVCATAALGVSTAVGSAVLSSQCGGGFYLLQSLNAADLVFTSGSFTYAIRLCGAVTSTSACQSLGTASVCQYNFGGGQVLASYSPPTPPVVWVYTGSGVSQIIQDGATCLNQNRLTNITLVCSPSATVPALVSVSEPVTCHYQIVIATNAVCGAPFLGLTPCVQQGFNLTALTGADLLYTGPSWDGSLHKWAIRPCGYITTPGFCGAQGGEFCQDATTISSMSLVDPSGVQAGNGAIWAQLSSGGQSGIAQILQDGTLCANATVSPTNSQFDNQGTIQYLCNASATTAFISSIVESPPCRFTAVVQTSVVCATAALGVSSAVGTAVLSGQCGGGFYALQGLNSADLQFSSGGWQYAVRVCGSVTSTTQCGPGVSICQFNSVPLQQALATFTPPSPAVVWVYNGNGMSQIIQDGAGCLDQSRLTNLTFVCNVSATTPVFLNEFESPTCHYQISVATNAVCGPPFAASASSSSSSTAVGSSSAIASSSARPLSVSSSAPSPSSSPPSSLSSSAPRAPSSSPSTAQSSSAPRLTSAPSSALSPSAFVSSSPVPASTGGAVTAASSSSSLGGGAIAGIVVGCVVGVLVVCCGLLFLRVARRSKGAPGGEREHDSGRSSGDGFAKHSDEVEMSEQAEAEGGQVHTGEDG